MLVVNVGLMSSPIKQTEMSIHCDLGDELRFFRRVGEKILLIGHSVELSSSLRCMATGVLGEFGHGEKNSTVAHINTIQDIDDIFDFENAPDAMFFDIHGVQEAQILRRVEEGRLKSVADLAAPDFLETPFIYITIGQQICEQLDRLCSYSGTKIGPGQSVAVPIDPNQSHETLKPQHCVLLEHTAGVCFTNLG